MLKSVFPSYTNLIQLTFAGLCLALIGSTLNAQPTLDQSRLPTPWTEITDDVTGDDIPDVLIAMPHSFDIDIVTLQIGGQYTPIVIPLPTNFTGEPGIEVTSSTTFDIRTGCFACGRYHSEILWRMAWRNEQLVVAGYRELSVDRNLGKVIVCDVNLRTGQSEILVDDVLRASPALAPISIPASEILTAHRPEQCSATSQYEAD
ncbi:MAG: hypothetical protein ABJM43_12760 [Paracoccaceae bacterium]